jgi:threonine/homoserine/homoserine lactone efflux protein
MDSVNLFLFLAAALLIALSPGPGIFYVAARTLAGGRREGLASSLGTGLGGLAHVGAGALGVSALVMASAEAFTVLKYVGAAYLVYLGVKTWRSAATPVAGTDAAPADAMRALKEGILVEALNPKTAAFFLAFIPQFVQPSAGHVALQFAALGLVSVTLNTAVDVVVVLAATAVRRRLLARPRLIRRLRQASGCVMGGLGLTLALARRPG